MTLVIARRIGRVIAAISDTRIMMNNADEGDIAKIAVIGKDIAVAFAGAVALGKEAINNIPDELRTGTSKETAEYFFNWHNVKERSVDFVIMGNNPFPAIWSVKNGAKTLCERAWIGDLEAYRAFQGYYMGRRACKELPANEHARIFAKEGCQEMIDKGQDPNRLNPTMRLIATMRPVLADRLVTSVGGYCIAVNNRFGPFSYRTYAVLTTGEDPPVIDKNGLLVLQPSEEQRQYAFSMLGSITIDHPALGLYFLRGRLAYLMFSSAKYVLDKIESFTDITLEEFCRKCKDKYNVELERFAFSLDDPAHFLPEAERVNWVQFPGRFKPTGGVGPISSFVASDV